MSTKFGGARQSKPKGSDNAPVLWGPRPRRSEREKVMFIAAAGVCFSLFLITILVLNFRSDAIAKEAVPPPVLETSNPGMVRVFTVARAVRAGEQISTVELKEAFWNRNTLPEGAVRDRVELQGMYAKALINPGEPLTRNQLTKTWIKPSLPVTPGNRAVSIEVDEISGLEGHALPGTRVDVVLTFMQEEALTSKIIVQNARIISAGGDTTSVSDLAQRAPSQLRRSAKTITLDVPVKDALEIQTARQLGRLSLFMRAAEDEKTASVMEATTHDIEGNQKRSGANSKKSAGCKAGRMRSGDKEFVIDCDGSVSEVVKDGVQ